LEESSPDVRARISLREDSKKLLNSSTFAMVDVSEVLVLLL
jgi:hypothetical protein